MKIMEFRHQELERTLNGLNDTGLPLIAKMEPNADEVFYYSGVYRDAGYTDDTGIYYFVPWITKTFGLSIDSGINLFITSLVLIALVVGIVCFFCIFKSWYSRLFAIFGQILFANYAYEYQDVYIASHFAVASVIPLFVLLTHKSTRFNFFLISSLGLSGIIVGYCNFVRLYSGLGVLFFVLLWIVLNSNLLKKEKVTSIAILFIFTALPYMHFSMLKAERNKFLVAQFPSYKEISHKHLTWHNIYLGLSYLNTKYVSEYGNDYCAFDAARAVNPNVIYCSDEHGQILKERLFQIVKEDPEYILKTVFSKCFILFLLVGKYLNFGLFSSFFVRFPIRSLLPFVGAFFIYALPGVLVLPDKRYILGMISLTFIFGLYMIGLGLEKFMKIKAARDLRIQ